MRRGLLTLALTFCLALFSVCGVAQEGSSSSVFSPYTMYGIGELNVGGSISSRLMGGLGIAVRRGDVFNYQNPASLSAIPQRSAIFNFGGEGYNSYSQSEYNKTSFNSFNMHDLGLAVPLTRGVGLGFSLTPVSSVGYSTTVIDDNPSVIENIGRAVYDYTGQGGVSQVSAHLGVTVVRGLALGVSAHYNFGVLDRYYNATLYPLITADNYRTVQNVQNVHVSQFNFTAGLQYTARVGAEAALTLGLIYVPRVNFKAEQTTFSATTLNGAFKDTIAFSREPYAMSIPDKYGAGLYYSNRYIGIGVDYSYQDWAGALDIPDGQNVHLTAKHDARFGVQYTPDRLSIRSAMARWTYKLGFRYSNSYLVHNNMKHNEYAISLGADIPLKVRSASMANVGFEFGQRGAKAQGQVLEMYWRVFVGVSLFGDDGWFQKRKFN